MGRERGSEEEEDAREEGRQGRGRHVENGKWSLTTRPPHARL